MADKGRYNVADLRYARKSSDSKKSDEFFDILIEQKKADENTRWLNTNEAAEFLRITPNALRILVHRAQVRYFKFGRRLRFRLCDLYLLFHEKEE